MTADRQAPHAFMSAAALNEAMAALGIAEIHFTPVEGNLWRVGISHDLPLAQLIRLLLANLSAVHLHRQEAVVLLDELAELLRQSRLATPSHDARAVAIVAELLHAVKQPLLAQPTIAEA